MFGEQYQLVKDAIFAAAQKHISNLNDLFNSVASKLIAAAKDFKCETVLSTDVSHKFVQFVQFVYKDHAFSTYVKFSEKVTFLIPPDKHSYVCVSEGKT